jgi:hypothetical protein
MVETQNLASLLVVGDDPHLTTETRGDTEKNKKLRVLGVLSGEIIGLKC